MSDPVANGAFGFVDTVTTNSGGSLVFTMKSGQGSRFPATSGGAYNISIYDSAYPSWAEAKIDGYATIARVTTLSTDTFTCTAAQESTSEITLSTTRTWRVERNLTALDYTQAGGGTTLYEYMAKLTFTAGTPAIDTVYKDSLTSVTPTMSQSGTGTYVFTFNEGTPFTEGQLMINGYCANLLGAEPYIKQYAVGFVSMVPKSLTIIVSADGSDVNNISITFQDSNDTYVDPDSSFVFLWVKKIV